ncbi:MAG: cytidylate kinase family protein [Patescibacteria group bacterium]
MAKAQIITISGKPGSGKSSTADRVAEMLGFTRHSSGDFVRKFVKEKGMTLKEYNDHAMDNHSLDERVDEMLRELRDHSEIIIDSRLGFYWIPESFKVYLDLDMQVAAARIFKDAVSNIGRSKSGLAGSIGEVNNQVKQRMQNERLRFRRRYGVDPYNSEHFDLIVDTSRHSPETVALTVFDNYKKWLESENWSQVRSSVPMGYSFKNQY